jgi:hypothetical protein
MLINFLCFVLYFVLHLSAGAELQVFMKSIFEMQFSRKITLKTTLQPGDGFMTQLSQMTNQLIQVEEADFEDVGPSHTL